MHLPSALSAGAERSSVHSGTLADNIRVVSWGADADRTRSPTKHVAEVMCDGLQVIGRVSSCPNCENLIEKYRVVCRTSSAYTYRKNINWLIHTQKKKKKKKKKNPNGKKKKLTKKH